MEQMPWNKDADQCQQVAAEMADLLLEPEQASAEARAHVAVCAACRAELAALGNTMSALDHWQAPEANPYFMTRFHAALAAERAAEPKGLLGRVMWRWRQQQSAPVRPMAAMALTVLLLVGGGGYLGIDNWEQTDSTPAAQAPVVNDLQSMDKNAQVLDELEALSTNNDN